MVWSMQMRQGTVAAVMSLAVAIMTSGDSGLADAYPERHVRITAYWSGTVHDIVARGLAESLRHAGNATSSLRAILPPD